MTADLPEHGSDELSLRGELKQLHEEGTYKATVEDPKEFWRDLWGLSKSNDLFAIERSAATPRMERDKALLRRALLRGAPLVRPKKSFNSTPGLGYLRV